jgi:hypothetical protein
VLEREPVNSTSYVGFVDPSGGSGDSYTVAVAHAEDGIGILDCLREVRPPFSPEAVTSEFGDLLKSYRVTKVCGDRYAGEWPREQFRKHGIVYEPSAEPKGTIYGNLLPLLNSGKNSATRQQAADHATDRVGTSNLTRWTRQHRSCPWRARRLRERSGWRSAARHGEAASACDRLSDKTATHPSTGPSDCSQSRMIPGFRFVAPA